ncbi:MAG: hypothetical protein U9Q98_02105, partial [Bacteroidota bacterium]|nr:hypothetical protein [Bacteroidota bacterium]
MALKNMIIKSNKRAKALRFFSGHLIISGLKARAIEARAIEESNNFITFAKGKFSIARIRALAQLPRPSGRGV